MWVLWTLVSLVVLAWLGYTWMTALFTKYEHTVASTAVLALLAAASLFAGLRIAQGIAPGWSAGPKGAVTLGVGFTLFCVFSFVAVNIWCSLLTRKFDDRIADLDEEEDSILRRLDALRWEALRQRGPFAQEVPQPEHPKVEDETVLLDRMVEAWEQGGAASRVRSLKVLEWREEAAKKTASELKQEIESLAREENQEMDETKKEQSRVKKALFKIVLLEKEGCRPESREASKETTTSRKDEIAADEASMRARLQAIHAEVQAEREKRVQFLRSRVRLSWRADR